MTFKTFSAALFLLTSFSLSASAQTLLEPHLTIKPGTHHAARVALTFDACMGRVDERILQALVDHKIRSTIFVTARWLKYNSKAAETLKEHPELFEIENHGAMHVPAIDEPRKIFGLAAAGSPAAVASEVESGAAAIEKVFGHKPQWFRGATGEYTATSEKQIQAMGYRIGGYSVLGDGGASFSEQKAAHVIGAAKDGDVIVAHINQPKKPAGAGVVEGILKLKAAGFVFLRLEDGV